MSIFEVAKLYVLVSIEPTDRFVKKVLLKVALRHPDKELAYEPADGELDIDVAVIVARVLATD